MLTRILAVSLLVMLPSASPQSVSHDVTGMLEYLSPTAMVLRLQDNREIQLRMPQTAARMEAFEMGDWVDVRYQNAAPRLDQELNLSLCAELTEIHPFRKPSDSELQSALASPIRKFSGNLLASPNVQMPSQEPQAASDAIKAIRQQVKTYLARIPEYAADETLQRFTSLDSPPLWMPADEIHDEIRFSGRREVRSKIMFQGKEWHAPFEALPGIKWRSAYVAKLRAIFAHPDKVSFEDQGSGEINGRPVHIYSYRAPADSISHWFLGEQGFWPATEGKFWISPQDGSVLRIESSCREFPADFPLSQVTESIVFDYVQIGDSKEVLPVASEVSLIRHDTGKAFLNKISFTNYRRLPVLPSTMLKAEVRFLLVSVAGGLVSSASTAGAAVTLAIHGTIPAETAGIATVLTSVTSAEDEAKFWLSPVSLASNNGFNSSTLTELHKIVRQNESICEEME